MNKGGNSGCCRCRCRFGSKTVKSEASRFVMGYRKGRTISILRPNWYIFNYGGWYYYLIFNISKRKYDSLVWSYFIVLTFRFCSFNSPEPNMSISSFFFLLISFISLPFLHRKMLQCFKKSVYFGCKVIFLFVN